MLVSFPGNYQGKIPAEKTDVGMIVGASLATCSVIIMICGIAVWYITRKRYGGGSRINLEETGRGGEFCLMSRLDKDTIAGLFIFSNKTFKLWTDH